VSTHITLYNTQNILKLVILRNPFILGNNQEDHKCEEICDTRILMDKRYRDSELSVFFKSNPQVNHLELSECSGLNGKLHVVSSNKLKRYVSSLTD